MCIGLSLTDYASAKFTAYEDGQSETADIDLLAQAHSLKRVLLSQDVDFVEIANAWLESGREFSGVIFAQQQKATTGESIDDLELICLTLTPEEMKNQFVRLPL